MLLVRQPKDSGLCVAACLAMLVDRDINYVLSKVHLHTVQRIPRPYLPMKEAIRFLYDHQYTYGIPLGFGVEGYRPTEGQTEIKLKAQVDHPTCNAILSVESKTIPGVTHAVVWSYFDKMVFDPQCDEPQPLSNYVIYEWANIGLFREM